MEITENSAFNVLSAIGEERDETYHIVRKMLDSLEQLCSFTDSAMYRHMKFLKTNSDFYVKLRKDLLEKSQEEETLHYMKGHEEWEKMILS